MNIAATPETDFASATIAQLGKLLRARRVSSVELTREMLGRIERFDGVIRSHICVDVEGALRAAGGLDEELAQGRDRGPLHRVPIGLKDLIDVAGMVTTANSRVTANRVATQDAALVARLRAAGAVILGKHNTHEFASGSSADLPFPAPRNPRNVLRVTGGSSSGSAASVASGLAYASIGTGTAGSIRMPAAYCGIVGLKPTYGLVSRRGIEPFSFSLDHAGPLARCVEDQPVGSGRGTAIAVRIRKVRARLCSSASRVSRDVRSLAARNYRQRK